MIRLSCPMLIVWFSLWALPSFASGIDGGGGGAFHCSGPGNGYMMIDLWEADHIPYRWPTSVGTIHVQYDKITPVNQQIQAALSKLSMADSAFAQAVENAVTHIQNNFYTLPNDISIPLPDDLRLEYFPTGCEPIGFMRYSNVMQRLNVVRYIFDFLRTKTDQAAAIMHEAIYKVLRDSYGHVDSIASRHLNACLFAPDCSLQLAAPQPDDRVRYECKGENNIQLTIEPVEYFNTLADMPSDQMVPWNLFLSKLGKTTYNHPQSIRVLAHKRQGENGHQIFKMHEVRPLELAKLQYALNAFQVLSYKSFIFTVQDIKYQSEPESLSGKVYIQKTDDDRATQPYFTCTKVRK